MKISTTATATTLTGLAALHVGWGTGSSFPFTDRATLADTVAGTAVAPRAPECYAVAGLLSCTAGLVGDVLPIDPKLRRIGVVGVAAVLGARGVLGVAGRTGAVVPWTPSERFNELDRRYYGPLCLALSAGASLSLRP